VPVGVEGHVDRRVPKAELDHLGMLDLNDQHGCVSVAQVCTEAAHRRRPVPRIAARPCGSGLEYEHCHGLPGR